MTVNVILMLTTLPDRCCWRRSTRGCGSCDADCPERVIRARRGRVDTAGGGSALIVRVILLGALVLGAMIAIKDGRLLRDAGLIGSCSQFPSVSGDQVFWQACRKGRLDGRPYFASSQARSM